MDLEVFESNYSVSRKAPGELSMDLPVLWEKLSLQRFAWLQLPWAIFFLLLLGSNYLPLGIIFLLVWIWQRKKPILTVCRSVEILVHLYFVLLLLGVNSLMDLLPGGPFVPIAIAGLIILLYEASARSWHYLFNYMLIINQEFADLAMLRGWVSRRVSLPVKIKSSSFFAISGLVMAIAAIVIMKLFSEA